MFHIQNVEAFYRVKCRFVVGITATNIPWIHGYFTTQALQTLGVKGAKVQVFTRSLVLIYFTSVCKYLFHKTLKWTLHRYLDTYKMLRSSASKILRKPLRW